MLYGWWIDCGYKGRIGFRDGKPVYMIFPTEQEYKDYMEDEDD